jgi:hypothetical protein
MLSLVVFDVRGIECAFGIQPSCSLKHASLFQGFRNGEKDHFFIREVNRSWKWRWRSNVQQLIRFTAASQAGLVAEKI